jgi:glycosyltransferase involved in cell wall biosynthesis
LGSVFDKELLNQLRFYSKLYFHGHSSGGTNPSLLEAMAASAMICAHDNVFNRAVLNGNGFFFQDEKEIAEIIQGNVDDTTKKMWVRQNIERLDTIYNWEKVIDAYYELFLHLKK